MEKNSGPEINIVKRLVTIICVKNSLLPIRIRDGKIRIRDKIPGSATLLFMFLKVTPTYTEKFLLPDLKGIVLNKNRYALYCPTGTV
jgi:hypothetical protein